MGDNGGVDGGHETGRCSQGAAEAVVVINVCKGKTTPLTATSGQGGSRRW